MGLVLNWWRGACAVEEGWSRDSVRARNDGRVPRLGRMWMLADDDPVLRIRLLYHGLESRAEEGSWYMFGVDASLGLMLVLKEEDGWDVLVEVYAQDMCRCVLGWGSCDACSLCNIMCCAPRRGLEGAHLSGATFVGHST